MIWIKPIGRLAAALWLLSAIPMALSQEQARIGDLSYWDRQYMAQQRVIMDDLAARNFGTQFNSNPDHDLNLLQRMLDQRLVRPDQTRELQAMGVIMGDLLAAELDLHWVIYEDRQGRSRALRYRSSEDYLFPITMISRRYAADNHTPVAIIYQKARAIIASAKPALPFQ